MFSRNYVPGDPAGTPSPSRVRVPTFHIPVPLYLGWVLLKLICKALVWLCKGSIVAAHHAYLSGPIAVMAALLWFTGWEVTLGLVIVTAVGLVGWWYKDRVSFWARLGWFYEAQYRRFTVYNRKLWRSTTGAVGLAQSFAGTTFYPSITAVSRDGFGDLLTVRLLAGQTPDDWAAVAFRFAHTFGARSSVMIHRGVARGEITLRLFHREVLTDLVVPLPVPAFPDLCRLPVARRADGSILHLSLPGHVLIVGATGAGKAGVQWSILSALAAQIHQGLVHVYGFDPKGGMELIVGKRLMHRLYYGSPEEMLGNLTDLVKIMIRRTNDLRGREVREYTPTVDEPTIVVMIDELATLTAYVSETKLRNNIKEMLGLILSQGRAPGVFVVASTQDPRKEVIPVRNHFATRIALRLNEKSDVEMVLSEDAVDNGAACHLIPRTLPGVAYVLEEGNPQPTRVRFPHMTDDVVRKIGYTCQAPGFEGAGQ